MGGATVYNVFLTSGTWFNTSFSSAALWTHWLQVCVPPSSTSTHAFVYVDGGDTATGDTPPPTWEPLAIGCAQSESVWAYLTAIPNEPVVFAADPTHSNRTEDGAITFGWQLFLNETVPGGSALETPLLMRFPMVRAAIRAIDVVQALVPEVSGAGVESVM